MRISGNADTRGVVTADRFGVGGICVRAIVLGNFFAGAVGLGPVMHFYSR